MERHKVGSRRFYPKDNLMGIFESTSIPIRKEMKAYSHFCSLSTPFSSRNIWLPEIRSLCDVSLTSWNFCPYHTNTLFTQLFTCNNQTALLRSTRLPLAWIVQSFQLSMYNQEKTLRCMWCSDGRRDLLILLCNLQRNHNLASWHWYKGQRGSVALFLLEGEPRFWLISSWPWCKNRSSWRMT